MLNAEAHKLRNAWAVTTEEKSTSSGRLNPQRSTGDVVEIMSRCRVVPQATGREGLRCRLLHSHSTSGCMRIELKAKTCVVFSWLEAISTRRCMIVSEGEETKLDLYRPVVDNLSSVAGKATSLSQVSSEKANQA
ncbi:hypothetical protein N7522_007888 [Penicillium canescens]|nr:hypothetical protein N7522_007888 [Penicillium canescens]